MKERLYETFEIINGIAPVQTTANTAINTAYVSASNAQEISAVLTVGLVNASTTAITLTANSTDGSETKNIVDYNGNAISLAITPNTKVSKVRIADPANAGNDTESITINGVEYTCNLLTEAKGNEYSTIAGLNELVTAEFPDFTVTTSTNDLIIESENDDITVSTEDAITITTEKATRVFSINPELIKEGHDKVRFSVVSAGNVALLGLTIFKNSYRNVTSNVSANEIV